MLILFMLPSLFLYTVNGRSEHILAIYGNDQSEIIVKDTKLRTTLKIFTTQVVATSGITIVYEKDLIFFSGEDGTIYRIHLVDEIGNRDISGNGKLFTNKDVDHFELVFYETGYPIIDLVYDEDDKMLYIITPLYILKFDPQVDPDEEKCFPKYSSMSSLNGQHAVISHGMLYVSDPYDIYNVPTAALGYAPHFSTFAELRSVTAFAIDNKKIFYFTENVMRVLDGNMKKNENPASFLSNQTKVVLANNAVTKDVHTLAVYGDVVVWSSCWWREIYVGKLNYRRNFIPMHSVYRLGFIHHQDEGDDDKCFRNIYLFKHVCQNRTI